MPLTSETMFHLPTSSGKSVPLHGRPRSTARHCAKLSIRRRFNTTNEDHLEKRGVVSTPLNRNQPKITFTECFRSSTLSRFSKCLLKGLLLNQPVSTRLHSWNSLSQNGGPVKARGPKRAREGRNPSLKRILGDQGWKMTSFYDGSPTTMD